MEQTKSIQPQQGEYTSSYDVKALFTLVTVDSALDIIHGRLQQDPQLSCKTYLSIHNIVTLLEFCLKSASFTFQGKYYEQAHGACRGSPISPLVADLLIENFEARTISTTPNPSGCGLGMWMTPLLSTRWSTWNISSPILIYLTPHTVYNRGPQQTGAISFLDTLVSLGPKGSLIASVYRNPHTQTNIHIVTITTVSHSNIVCLTPSHTGTRLFAQTNNNILGQPLVGVITLTGSSIDYKPNWTFHLVSRITTLTTV